MTPRTKCYVYFTFHKLYIANRFEPDYKDAAKPLKALIKMLIAVNFLPIEDCIVHALECQPKKSDPKKHKPSLRLLVKPVTESPEADEDLQVAQGPKFLSGQ